MVTTNNVDGALNSARTDSVLSSVISQVEFAPSQEPDQPTKQEFPVADAVSVTAAIVKFALHVVPQVIPVGSDVILPWPVPPLVTANSTWPMPPSAAVPWPPGSALTISVALCLPNDWV